ncbi:hypothetical protein WOLCODRAFT_139864 [Wolfiporia cocos MD-104 SS10]|uniref:Uncharacterized protein n=1 Tax=Wolfiporia cocos (strain MD-104) TaxID=742152 RepID=A0A2H3J050_WOLCO|nr:hypothetical protein WOLCODRAFT_139864 [Wolfiporia cocos MD-104 SS10]
MHPARTRSWTASPTRRELTLLLFSLTLFVLSYNLETSLRLAGVPSQRLHAFSTIGLGSQDPGLDPDGRRPKEWRDELENLIVGEWSWEPGRVAGVEHGSSGAIIGKSGAAIYNAAPGAAVGRSAGREDRGVGVTTGPTPNEQLWRWGAEVPQASTIAHVPGYTILDNVIVVNGTFFLVTDEPASLPELGLIASSAEDRTQPPREQDWQVLSTQEAAAKIDTFGGRITGTTWLALDPSSSQDPYTLFSLFRTHSTLAAPPLDAQDQTSPAKMPAPMRLIFPNVPTFSSPHIPPDGDDIKKHPPPRIRSYNGIHPLLPKVALPTVGIWYTEDWQDLIDSQAPWIFERVVIADRAAADRGRELWARRWTSSRPSSQELRKRAEGDEWDVSGAEDGEDVPAWAAPLVGLPAPTTWWAPVRASLLSYLQVDERETKKGKPVVTYVSMQQEPAGAGPRLLDVDDGALVAGLRGLERDGVLGAVHVVKGNGSVSGPEWADRMRAFAESSIVLGPYGHHLADSVFMEPPAWMHQSSSTSSVAASDNKSDQPAPLLMEFFAPGTFMRDREYAMRVLGMRYIAWWNERKFTGSSLPPVIRPESTEEYLSVDVDAILRTVREVVQRRVPSG